MTRCYLYGRGEAGALALMNDRAFLRLLEGLFAGGLARPADEAEKDAATRAVQSSLLRAEGAGYAAGPRLVPIPRQATRDAAVRMAPALDRYADLAARAAAELRRAFGRTTAGASHPWAAVEHTLVAGMLLDLSVGSRLHLQGHVRRGYDETLLWAFEESPGGNAFGVRWTPAADEAAGLAQLWHRGVRRPELRVPPAAVAALARLALGDGAPLPPRDGLLLRYLGLVEAGPAGERCTVPAFGAADMDEHLLPVLWDAAERLVDRGVLPALEEGRRAAWWSRHAGEDAVHHALVRMVLERGTDRVVETGGVSPFPAGVPDASWGRWLWTERPGPRTLVAGAFEHALAGAAGRGG